MTAAEASAARLIARVGAAAGLPDRAGAAPRLAAAARALLPHTGRRPDQPDPLTAAEQAVPPVPAWPPATAADLAAAEQALQHASALETAAWEVLTAATASLETAWAAMDTARRRVAAVRPLLQGVSEPEAARLTARIDAALGGWTNSSPAGGGRARRSGSRRQTSRGPCRYSPRSRRAPGARAAPWPTG